MRDMSYVYRKMLNSDAGKIKDIKKLHGHIAIAASIMRNRYTDNLNNQSWENKFHQYFMPKDIVDSLKIIMHQLDNFDTLDEI